MNELRALVFQAWEFRETPYFTDACQAIIDWYERLPLTLFEAEQERRSRLIRLLRETNPDIVVTRSAA